MSSESNNPNQRSIKCPECGRLTVYTLENKSRPFCSERCKLIDLGQWAEESFRIPAEQNSDSSEDDISEEDPEKYE